jgi:hypothetical protein
MPFYGGQKKLPPYKIYKIFVKDGGQKKLPTLQNLQNHGLLEYKALA